MIPNVAARYQEVQITSSNPGETLIALLDGLFRFLNVARYGLRNQQRARAGEAMSKAHAIVSELYLSLDRSRAPDLCDNLAALYEFSLGRLTQANLKNDPNAIDEIVRALTPVREAFTTIVRANPRQQMREGA